MKLISSILTSGLLFLGINAAAQTNKATNTRSQSIATPVTKGYYAIGNNAAKLAAPTNVVSNADGSYPVIQKGYYSIGNNNKKLGKQMVIVGKALPAAPRATKGYYSIERKETNKD